MRVYPKQTCQMEAGPLACARHHTRGGTVADGGDLRRRQRSCVKPPSVMSYTQVFHHSQSALTSLYSTGSGNCTARYTLTELLICPTSVAMRYPRCPLESRVEAPPSKARRTLRGYWPRWFEERNVTTGRPRVRLDILACLRF